MIRWIRCRSCRTLGDPERTPFCPACGDELRPGDPGAPREAPEVERSAARDLRSSTGVIGGLGVLGLVGLSWFFFLNLGSALRGVSVVGLLLLIGGTVYFLSRKDDPKVAAAGRAVLKGFAVVGVLFIAGIALIFALIVYLFVLCAGGARFAG